MKYRILLICVLSSAYASAQTKPTTSKPATTKTPVKTASATPVLKNALDSFSYAIGMSVGNFCAQQQIKNLNSNLVMKGVKDAGGKPLMTEQQMNVVISSYLNKRNTERSAAIKAEGQKFLEENAKKPGVVTTASGLQYQVLKAGTDTIKARYTDAVVCNYRGTLLNGNEFDNSNRHGGSVTFNVNEMVTGWIEALQMMPKGSKWRLWVPSNLGYGDRAMGNDIPAGSTLVFELEVLDV